MLDLADEKGAYCGRVLGDFGADVIAVEPPEGNPARRGGPFFRDQVDLEKSLHWFYTAANKRSITLNLEAAAGREIFLRLIETADIVIESGPPGRMEALGLGYQVLRCRKPSLVMTSITPFGQTGPYHQYAVDDLVLTAMGGLARMYGYLDGPPMRITAPQAYFHGSMHGAVGSVLAYYHADLTGEGQFVDVSMQEAIVLSLMRATEIWDLLKVNPRGYGPFQIQPRPAPEPPLFLRWVFPVADGYVLMMIGGGAQAGLVASSRKIVELANVDGYALELADYPWETLNAASLTQKDADQLFDAIAAWLQTKTKAELFAAAVEFGLLFAPVNTTADIATSPQLAYREFWTSVEHPELATILTYPGPAVKVPAAPCTIRRRAPLLGEHNWEIYGGELGLPREQIIDLKEAKII